MDFNSSHFNSDQIMTFGLTWAVLPMIGMFLVHIGFGVAVLHDANRLQKEHGSLAFVSAWLWSLAVLLGGVFVALAYWVIHHSALAKR
ncbi:hypothetical protein A5320_12020 [Rheinheimera sp. SA_1]|jgi:hypothetical protein|uniref:hypothetical protein n=1 Tax=Rheinheimera sp. SA_1 TaxID=1827365 RepID=UPI000801CF3B|nr:hypothetical protein [Rheinheimera sp. SA_1]OBP14488.1 hypothetical protein A5320_12020 [Rheinheimera sp. SA_1]